MTDAIDKRLIECIIKIFICEEQMKVSGVYIYIYAYTEREGLGEHCDQESSSSSVFKLRFRL